MDAPSRKILRNPLDALLSVPYPAHTEVNLLPQGKWNPVDRVGINIFMASLIQQRKDHRRFFSIHDCEELLLSRCLRCVRLAHQRCRKICGCEIFIRSANSSLCRSHDSHCEQQRQ